MKITFPQAVASNATINSTEKTFNPFRSDFMSEIRLPTITIQLKLLIISVPICFFYFRFHFQHFSEIR